MSQRHHTGCVRSGQQVQEMKGVGERIGGRSESDERGGGRGGGAGEKDA